VLAELCCKATSFLRLFLLLEELLLWRIILKAVFRY
jgi:hypothetical protein